MSTRRFSSVSNETPSTVLREADAARFLGVSPRQLRRWRDEKRIRHSRPHPESRIVWYRVSDLEEFVASGEVPPVVVRMTR
jgi:transposase-like protein